MTDDFVAFFIPQIIMKQTFSRKKFKMVLNLALNFKKISALFFEIFYKNASQQEFMDNDILYAGEKMNL